MNKLARIDGRISIKQHFHNIVVAGEFNENKTQKIRKYRIATTIFLACVHEIGIESMRRMNMLTLCVGNNSNNVFFCSYE